MTTADFAHTVAQKSIPGRAPDVSNAPYSLITAYTHAGGSQPRYRAYLDPARYLFQAALADA